MLGHDLFFSFDDGSRCALRGVIGNFNLVGGFQFYINNFLYVLYILYLWISTAFEKKHPKFPPTLPLPKKKQKTRPETWRLSVSLFSAKWPFFKFQVNRFNSFGLSTYLPPPLKRKKNHQKIAGLIFSGRFLAIGFPKNTGFKLTRFSPENRTSQDVSS